MLSINRSGPASSLRQEPSFYSRKISPLFGRVNWEKCTIYSNLALIISGIAYAFFLNLPKIGIGLSLYCIYYIVLQTKSQQASVSAANQKSAQAESERAQEARRLDREIAEKKKELKETNKLIETAETQLDGLNKKIKEKANALTAFKHSQSREARSSR